MVFIKQNFAVKNVRMLFQRGMEGMPTKGYTAVWLCGWSHHILLVLGVKMMKEGESRTRRA